MKPETMQSLSPAATAPAPARPSSAASARLQAWRLAVEREHARIAAASRSVKPAGTHESVSLRAQTATAHAPGELALPASGAPGVKHHAWQAPVQTGSAGGQAGPPGAALPAAAAMQEGLARASVAFAAPVASAPATHGPDMKSAQSPSALPRALSMHDCVPATTWPQRRMHVACNTDGVVVSIRDPSLSDCSGHSLDLLARQLRATLKADGMLLAAMVVNGKPVLPPPAAPAPTGQQRLQPSSQPGTGPGAASNAGPVPADGAPTSAAGTSRPTT